jgi:hypothetical protein
MLNLGGKYSNVTVSRPNNVEMYNQLGPRWSYEVLIYSQVRSCKRQLEILGKHQGQSGQNRSEENNPNSYRKSVIGRPFCSSQAVTTYIRTFNKNKKKDLNFSRGFMSGQQNLNHFVAACLTPRLVEILVIRTNGQAQTNSTRPTHCVQKHGQFWIRSRALEGSLAGINSLSYYIKLHLAHGGCSV